MSNSKNLSDLNNATFALAILLLAIMILASVAVMYKAGISFEHLNNSNDLYPCLLPIAFLWPVILIFNYKKAAIILLIFQFTISIPVINFGTAMGFDACSGTGGGSEICLSNICDNAQDTLSDIQFFLDCDNGYPIEVSTTGKLLMSYKCDSNRFLNEEIKLCLP